MILKMKKQPNITRLERTLGAMTALLERPATRENHERFYRMTQRYRAALGQFDYFNPPARLFGYFDRGAELIEDEIVKYARMAA